MKEFSPEEVEALMRRRDRATKRQEVWKIAEKKCQAN